MSRTTQCETCGKTIWDTHCYCDECSDLEHSIIELEGRIGKQSLIERLDNLKEKKQKLIDRAHSGINDYQGEES